MLKKILKYFSYSIILTGLLLGYLSFFGIETKSFNKLIQETLSKSDDKVKAKLDKVKILLNLSDFSINIKASDVDLMNEDKKIQLKNVSTNFSLVAFLKKEFGIKNVSIESKDNNLKDVVNFIRIYKNNAQLIIFEKLLKKGLINADIELNFGEDGKIKKNYKLKGIVKEAEFRLLNKDIISNIDFNFDIQKNLYSIKSAKIQYKGIDFLSKNIKITALPKDTVQHLNIEGDISHKTTNLDSKQLAIFFKENTKNLKNIKLSSDSNFFINIRKNKIENYGINSKIKLDELNYKIDQAKIKDYIPNFKGSIDFEDHEIKLSIGKDDISAKGEGNYLIVTKPEKINYEIRKTTKSFNFMSEININEAPLNLEFLNYQKKENKDSTLFIDFHIGEKNLNFKKISFSESKNNFLINNINLTKNFKINNINLVDLDFVNNNKQKNKIFLKRDKKKYLITGEIFDGSKLLEEILTGNDEGGISRFFNNLNSSIKINLDKVFIGDGDFLKSLKSDIKFKKNNLASLNLSGHFVDNKKLTLTIRTNANNEKITTLFAENAKPLVKKYKFIKGFEDGSLDYYSIKKNDLSKSKLKINNFKLKEVPALTKILTLASLQGIADLLTGEGIRFDDFEMDFDSKKKLMTINEIYAIGPAISILMEGYIESKKLVSLRGTLVPATTINKAIGKIPILGKILVGKKTGEGVFGVSFKIKGPPKKLKTTVNPIKTLTPRFITRTLEKIKKTEVEVKNTP